VLGVAALGLVALAAVGAPRINSQSVPVPAQSIVAEVSAAYVPLNVVAPGDCWQSAYVTGDMAGDASPAEIYAKLCGGR
jgi:hypothetical protein